MTVFRHFWGRFWARFRCKRADFGLGSLVSRWYWADFGLRSTIDGLAVGVLPRRDRHLVEKPRGPRTVAFWSALAALLVRSQLVRSHQFGRAALVRLTKKATTEPSIGFSTRARSRRAEHLLLGLYIRILAFARTRRRRCCAS